MPVRIDDVHVALGGFKLADATPAQLTYHHHNGDGFGLYFFQLPPDLPAPLEAIDALRAFYRRGVQAAGGGLVAVETITLRKHAALRTIIKLPQQPSGMTYVGSVTLPFRDFSFVLKFQCPERGMTGMRDAVVFSKVGQLDAAGAPVGWAADPYDPAAREGVLRNRADDSEWDGQFPDHPLSRLRGYLGQLERAVDIAPALEKVARFTGRG